MTAGSSNPLSDMAVAALEESGRRSEWAERYYLSQTGGVTDRCGRRLQEAAIDKGSEG